MGSLNCFPPPPTVALIGDKGTIAGSQSQVSAKVGSMASCYEVIVQ